MGQMPHLQDHHLSNLGWLGRGGGTRTSEEVEGEEVPEGPEVGVGKQASTGIESISTSRDVSIGISLLLLVSSRVYSASICRMLVKEDGVTSVSLVGSLGSLARRHNSVISTRNGRELCL
ncbi:hypothetical protein H5410_040651 [Solanum commersonii]|uniref:Uncharacterized protein n=1 Tax=Solanum commersonii TaxID=4109 RepID=A0A9J5XPK2_SOLCO|nr:hypothetical protein H5410_040651 [Solanum commersonii]